MLADRMLGKLARLLRMMGQDVEYVREGDPQEIMRLAAREGRVLLTRDRRLAKRKDAGEILFVENNYPFHQARQVIRELDLTIDLEFRRCVEDNGLLQTVPKESVRDRVPPYVLDTVRAFYRCDRCARVYWEGTHVHAMRKMVDGLKDAPLVPGESDESIVEEASQPGSKTRTQEMNTLEPLVVLHQAMEVLFLRHRLALMDGEIPRALQMLRRFAMCMRRHVEDEREIVLPLYADAQPAEGYERGATPELFENEHRKILEHLETMESVTESLLRDRGDRESVRAKCLKLLDREKVFSDLLEHHDLRERTHLYPALEHILAEEEKQDLLERMIGLTVEETHERDDDDRI